MTAREYYDSFNPGAQQQQPPDYPPPQYQELPHGQQHQQQNENQGVQTQQLPYPDYKAVYPGYPHPSEMPQPPPQPLQQYYSPPQQYQQPYQSPQPPYHQPYVQTPQTDTYARPQPPFASDPSLAHLRPSRSYSEPPSSNYTSRHHHERSPSPTYSHSHSRTRHRSRSRSRRPRSSRKEGHHSSRNTFLGAFGGSVIGDAIFPGLGTLGGAIIGGVAGNESAKKRKSASARPRGHRMTYEEEWEEGRRRRGEDY